MGKVHYLLTKLDIGRSRVYLKTEAIDSYSQLFPANPGSTR